MNVVCHLNGLAVSYHLTNRLSMSGNKLYTKQALSPAMHNSALQKHTNTCSFNRSFTFIHLPPSLYLKFKFCVKMSEWHQKKNKYMLSQRNGKYSISTVLLNVAVSKVHSSCRRRVWWPTRSFLCDLVRKKMFFCTPHPEQDKSVRNKERRALCTRYGSTPS